MSERVLWDSSGAIGLAWEEWSTALNQWVTRWRYFNPNHRSVAEAPDATE